MTSVMLGLAAASFCFLLGVWVRGWISAWARAWRGSEGLLVARRPELQERCANCGERFGEHASNEVAMSPGGPITKYVCPRQSGFFRREKVTT